MKPNFAAMTKAELRTYVLNHRDDAEAFQALTDRIVSSSNFRRFAPEDADRFPEIYEEHRKRKEADSDN
jgi:hypothetical protein